jgi:hypothetical protein
MLDIFNAAKTAITAATAGAIVSLQEEVV